MHHSIADGIGFVMLAANLQDNPKLEELPRLTVRIPPLKKIFMWLCLPITLNMAAFNVLVSLKKPNCVFKTNEKAAAATPLKQGCFCPDVSLELLKKKSKENNASINDFVMAILSLSVSQYVQRKHKG